MRVSAIVFEILFRLCSAYCDMYCTSFHYNIEHGKQRFFGAIFLDSWPVLNRVLVFALFNGPATQYAEWDLNKISKTIAETLIALFLIP